LEILIDDQPQQRATQSVGVDALGAGLLKGRLEMTFRDGGR
jgi:hypothetical protein